MSQRQRDYVGYLVLKFIPGLDIAVSVPVWGDRSAAWSPVDVTSLGAFADPAVLVQLPVSELVPAPLGAIASSEIVAIGEALAAILGLADPAFLDDPPRPPEVPPGMRPVPGWGEVRGRRIEGIDGGVKPYVVVSCDRANRRFDEQASADEVHSIRIAVRLTTQPNVRPRAEFPELSIGSRSACGQLATAPLAWLGTRLESSPALVPVADMRLIADGIMAALDFV